MQLAAFGLGSGGSESEQMSPLRAIPQTAEVLGVTWTESLLVFKDRCLGSFLSQVWVLRVGEPNVGFKHFAPQGKTWGVLSSLLIIDCCVGGGVYGDIVSQPLPPFLMCVCVCVCVCVCLFPFASCIVIAQPAFRFFFRGKNFVYRNTVSMGGGEFRILLNHSLEPQETSLLVHFNSVQSLSRV